MTSVFAVEDFTGGLNLRADVFNIGKNESPDLLNVDIDPRGGVAMRAGSQEINTRSLTGLAYVPHRLYHWRRSFPNQQLLFAFGNEVHYATETDFTDLNITTSNAHGAEFAQWIGDTNYLYIAAGYSTTSYKWDGATATALSDPAPSNWADDLLSPTTGYMPKAEHIAEHVDRIWVAHTEENGTEYPDRVRWSHPLFPEAWRENDYIDVVGGGSGIRALVPFSNHILVFKDHAVFAIYGYNQATFQLVPITQELGTYSSKTVAASEQAIYFFSWPDGLFRYDGSRIEDVFAPLRPLVERNEINQGALETVHVDWMTRRVFLSLPTGNNPTSVEDYDDTSGGGATYDDADLKFDGFARPDAATDTFVYDPSVGKNGAWTRYSLANGYAMVCGVDYTTPLGISGGYFTSPVNQYVMRFKDDLPNDMIDETYTNFESFYTVAWQDLGQPQAKKFWRSPEFVVTNRNQSYNLDVNVFHDWNTLTPDRTFTVNYVSSSDLSSPFNVDQWTELYGSEVVRGDTLGSARSVQIRFGSSGGIKWGVNGVVYRYSFRKVRV
jgi:hypothetical protein